METTVKSMPELITFIENNPLTSSQICEILHRGYMLFADEEKPPQVLIQELKDHWNKYGNIKERPLFLNLNLDVKE